MISKVLVVTVMPPLGATPFPCFFTPSSSVCLIFPGGCSLIVVDRELYGGIPPVCFDSEGGADPATTWKPVGTSASSSVCLIFPGGCSLIIVDRELYSGIPSVCFDSEGGADPATTWKSAGTSAGGEEKRGVDGGVCVWCSSKRNFGNFTTNG